MENKTSTIQGVVKALRKDRKGLQLMNETWYANKFKPEINGVDRGDEVKIVYTTNGTFNNHETVTLISKGEKLPGFNPAIAEQGEKSRKNMCISYAKDMYTAEIAALLPKCKDLKQAEEVMKIRRDKIVGTAKSLFDSVELMEKVKVTTDEEKVGDLMGEDPTPEVKGGKDDKNKV